MATEAETFQGSRHVGALPMGCIQCRQGAKLVLFVTGLCPSDCFYCPVAEHKIDHDVVYANERKLEGEDVDDWLPQLFEEVRDTGAWGTGITGGDPLADPDRVCAFIRALKAEYGPEHHIHLYTQQFARTETIRALAEAGLDELRIHPHSWLFSKFAETPYARMVADARAAGMRMGVEVPCFPDREEDILALARQAHDAGAEFLNMNELEYSTVNADALRDRDYVLRGDEDNRVAASMETGYRIVQTLRPELPGFTVHLCSSRFKDGTQLTKRLGRRSARTAKPYMEPTEENTLVFGILQGDEEALIKAYDRLVTEFEVPIEWVGLRHEPSPRIELAPWVLEEVYEAFLDLEPTLVEEYPTADHLEVERIPLRENPPETLADDAPPAPQA